MNLIDICDSEEQKMKQEMNQETVQAETQNPEQAVQAEVPEEAVQEAKQEAVQDVNAGVPADVEQSAEQAVVQGVNSDAPEDAEHGMKQDLKQKEQDAPEEVASAVVDAADAGEPAFRLPPKKIRPSLTTISLRVTKKEKEELQKMADERSMSLGEFFACIARSILAQAAGKGSKAA